VTLHDHDLELRVLATIADVSAVDVTEAKTAAESSQLSADDFHNPLHRAVWSAQIGLLFEGEAADFYRAATRLGDANRQAVPSLAERASQAGVSLLVGSAIRGAADDLRAMTLRRTILRFGRELAQQAEAGGDPAVMLTNATAALGRIATSRSANWRTLGHALAEVRAELAQRAQTKQSSVVPTGLGEWDRWIGGLYPTLTVLGAHAGNAKSGLIGRLLLNAARMGLKCCLFSLEDQRTWLAYRALAAESGLSQFALRNRVLTDEQEWQVQQAEKGMADYESLIEIDDRGALTPAEVVQSARDAILNRGAKLVVVDHWGETRVERGDGWDRHDLAVAEGLSDVRNLAKGYGVPVIVACHLKPAATYPFSQHDFRNAAAFQHMARVAVMWELDREASELKMCVVKNQYGLGSCLFRLRFDGASALVAEDETPKAKQEVLL
jgi:replicative DNA helicase